MATAPTPLLRPGVTLEAAADATLTSVGAATDAAFDAKTPGDSGTPLDTPAATEQYSIECFQFSLSAASSVTLKNDSGAGATKIIWGPHPFPAAGVFQFVFPRGLKVGAGKVPLLTTTAGNIVADLCAVRIAAQ